MASSRRAGAILGLLAMVLVLGSLFVPLSTQSMDRMGSDSGGQVENYAFGVESPAGHQSYRGNDHYGSSGLAFFGGILIIASLLVGVFTVIIGFIEHSEPAWFPLISGGFTILFVTTGMVLHLVGVGDLRPQMTTGLGVGGVLLLFGIGLQVSSLVVPVVLSRSEAVQAQQA